jgi:hypothetical protein
MPGPSQASPVVEFLRRKREREASLKEEQAERPGASREAGPSQDQEAQMRKDFAEALRQLRAFICVDKRR